MKRVLVRAIGALLASVIVLGACSGGVVAADGDVGWSVIFGPDPGPPDPLDAGDDNVASVTTADSEWRTVAVSDSGNAAVQVNVAGDRAGAVRILLSCEECASNASALGDGGGEAGAAGPAALSAADGSDPDASAQYVVRLNQTNYALQDATALAVAVTDGTEDGSARNVAVSLSSNRVVQVNVRDDGDGGVAIDVAQCEGCASLDGSTGTVSWPTSTDGDDPLLVQSIDPSDGSATAAVRNVTFIDQTNYAVQNASAVAIARGNANNTTNVAVSIARNTAIQVNYVSLGDDSDEEAYTRDEIAQAVFGASFADLDAGNASRVEEIYNRQPLAVGLDADDVQTRDAIARQWYGNPLSELDREERIAVEDAFGVQFVCPPAAGVTTYTRDEIAQAKYGYDFANLSGDTSREIEEIYDRQPFSRYYAPRHVMTRDEIAQHRYDHDFDDLSRETALHVQDLFDVQFRCTADAIDN
jgi:hypothetical protein